jgi:hypothetical protein
MVMWRLFFFLLLRGRPKGCGKDRVDKMVERMSPRERDAVLVRVHWWRGFPEYCSAQTWRCLRLCCEGDRGLELDGGASCGMF